MVTMGDTVWCGKYFSVKRNCKFKLVCYFCNKTIMANRMENHLRVVHRKSNTCCWCGHDKANYMHKFRCFLLRRETKKFVQKFHDAPEPTATTFELACVFCKDAQTNMPEHFKETHSNILDVCIWCGIDTNLHRKYEEDYCYKIRELLCKIEPIKSKNFKHIYRRTITRARCNVSCILCTATLQGRLIETHFDSAHSADVNICHWCGIENATWKHKFICFNVKRILDKLLVKLPRESLQNIMRHHIHRDQMVPVNYSTNPTCYLLHLIGFLHEQLNQANLQLTHEKSTHRQMQIDLAAALENVAKLQSIIDNIKCLIQ